MYMHIHVAIIIILKGKSLYVKYIQILPYKVKLHHERMRFNGHSELVWDLLLLHSYCFLFYFSSHDSVQKYLHESRHLHAVKRNRGYSGRFSGKNQEQSPQKSPGTPVSGSLPPTQQPPPPPLVHKSLSSGSSELASGGAGFFPLTSHYQSVSSSVAESLVGNIVQAVNVVPEICTAESIDASVTSSQDGALALNQLGVNPITQPSPSVGPTITTSGADQHLQQSIGDATIQGLINATQNFTIPILPTDIVPTLSSHTIASSVPDTAELDTSNLLLSTADPSHSVSSVASHAVTVASGGTMLPPISEQSGVSIVSTGPLDVSKSLPISGIGTAAGTSGSPEKINVDGQ